MIKITDKCKHCNITCTNHVQNIKNHQGNICRCCKSRNDNKDRVPVDLYVNGFFHRTRYWGSYQPFIKETIYSSNEHETVMFQIKELWENDTSEIRIIGELNNHDIVKDRETGMLKRFNTTIPSYITSVLMEEPIEDRFEILDI